MTMALGELLDMEVALPAETRIRDLCLEARSLKALRMSRHEVFC